MNRVKAELILSDCLTGKKQTDGVKELEEKYNRVSGAMCFHYLRRGAGHALHN